MNIKAAIDAIREGWAPAMTQRTRAFAADVGAIDPELGRLVLQVALSIENVYAYVARKTEGR